ncbi:MAG: hypothetical protein KGJ13_06565 [Patescibacteria group bacterium]|nr:hypothetical protein [Patescibacteria group bacterium]
MRRIFFIIGIIVLAAIIAFALWLKLKGQNPRMLGTPFPLSPNQQVLTQSKVVFDAIPTASSTAPILISALPRDVQSLLVIGALQSSARTVAFGNRGTGFLVNYVATGTISGLQAALVSGAAPFWTQYFSSGNSTGTFSFVDFVSAKDATGTIARAEFTGINGNLIGVQIRVEMKKP